MPHSGRLQPGHTNTRVSATHGHPPRRRREARQAPCRVHGRDRCLRRRLFGCVRKQGHGVPVDVLVCAAAAAERDVNAELAQHKVRPDEVLNDLQNVGLRDEARVAPWPGKRRAEIVAARTCSQAAVRGAWSVCAVGTATEPRGRATGASEAGGEHGAASRGHGSARACLCRCRVPPASVSPASGRRARPGDQPARRGTRSVAARTCAVQAAPARACTHTYTHTTHTAHTQHTAHTHYTHNTQHTRACTVTHAVDKSVDDFNAHTGTGPLVRTHRHTFEHTLDQGGAAHHPWTKEAYAPVLARVLASTVDEGAWVLGRVPQPVAGRRRRSDVHMSAARCPRCR